MSTTSATTLRAETAPRGNNGHSELSLDDAMGACEGLIERVQQVFRGKDTLVRDAATAVISGGHLLLEDVPGVGKTTLATAFARTLGCTFRRIQFTSDLLPSDIIGVSVLDSQSGAFDFKPGPIFSQVILADEINRAPPRSQSALLEAMSEGTVSVENQTHALPKPFWVVATQNPLEYHGTYPLPESQMDRFFMRLSIGYPDLGAERDVVAAGGLTQSAAELDALFTPETLLSLQASVDVVKAESSILDYVMSIVEATRRSELLSLGCSTRGAIALFRAARARALVSGRGYCIPDDVQAVCVPVLAHRVVSRAAEQSGYADREAGEATVLEVVADVPLPV